MRLSSYVGKKPNLKDCWNKERRRASMNRLDELKMKLAEVDRLIGDILDSEPESEHGKYGKEIGALFQDMSWIDFCCITESEN